MGSRRERRETACAADRLPQRTAAAPVALLGLQRLAGNRAVDALLTGATKAPGTGFVVQRREENNAPLAEIQGLPMYDLLPRLARLGEQVLRDEEAGGLVGGPRLVLAMQTVRAKMQRDLEFLLREKNRVETLPRDQIADIVNFLWGPSVGTSIALVNTDLEMEPIIAPPASVRLPGEPAHAGDGGIVVDDESGPQGISDFEEDLPENRNRISGVVLDPETREIIGYRTFHADGISRLVDREGNFVVDAGVAIGVESEGLGPLDYVPTPSGVGKGAAGVAAKLLVKGALKKGTATGGKVTLGVILKMRSVAKAVAKKAISPNAEGKAFIQAVRSGQRVSRTLSVEAAESLTKKFDKGAPIVASELNKRGIIGPLIPSRCSPEATAARTRPITSLNSPCSSILGTTSKRPRRSF